MGQMSVCRVCPVATPALADQFRHVPHAILKPQCTILVSIRQHATLAVQMVNIKMKSIHQMYV
jgi:hypothetical protein